MLKEAGETIKLRRVVGASVQSQQAVDVECLAKVSGQSSDDLAGGVSQNELYCILSPSEINRAQWPGGMVVSATPGLDPRIPSKTRGDKAFVRGRWRAVRWATGEYPKGELVVIKMRVEG